jgi:hypothetical protein
MNPDYKILWDYAINVGLKAGHELRIQLHLNEDNFRHRAPYSHSNSRNVYIYRAIDEVQKAATCLMRWKEFCSDVDMSNYNEDVKKHMMRITRQSVFDEQSLRCRKLTESLVDTILFLNTNEDIYFKDYFYFSELFEFQNAQGDRKEFYGFTNRNSEDHIQWLKSQILKLESTGLKIANRWYVKTAKSITALKKAELSSFRAKYKKIAKDQGPEIIMLLAKSYLHAYGESRDIHFSANDTSHSFSDDSCVNKGTKVALLLIHLIVKLQGLSLLGFNQSADILSGIRSDIASTKPYMELTAPSAQVGDYVLVWGDLGKVMEVGTSEYGFCGYHIRYIDKPPLENITDDWFASFEISRIGSKTELLENVKSVLSKYSEQKIDDNAIASINDAEFEKYLSLCITDILK